MPQVDIPEDFLRTTLGMLFPPRLFRGDIQEWLGHEVAGRWRLEERRERDGEGERRSWVIAFEREEDAAAFRSAWL